MDVNDTSCVVRFGTRSDHLPATTRSPTNARAQTKPGAPTQHRVQRVNEKSGKRKKEKKKKKKEDKQPFNEGQRDR